MERYKNTSIFGRKFQYYGTTKYPVIPLSSEDIYVITQEDDRYDQLALEYYGDASLWWVISSSNPGLAQNSYSPPVGIQIRIPQNLAPIMNAMQTLNDR